MEIKDLVFDESGGWFDEMPDLDAVISAWVDDGEMFYGCAINPRIEPEYERGALTWCAQLVTRIEDHGFDKAMEMDAWQHRSDGRWQLWGRRHYLHEPVDPLDPLLLADRGVNHR